MIGPLQENARMLASLIGVDEDEAAERLDCTVLMLSLIHISEPTRPY